MNNLFNLPTRATKAGDMELLSKIKTVKPAPLKSIKAKAGNVLDKITAIKEMVEKYLGQYKERYRIITEEEELIKYIDNCILNNEVAIDTETDGLDTMTCNMAGICLYTPNNLACYIPINHMDYITGQRIKNQLSLEAVKKQIQRIKEHKVKTFFYNAKFDIRVIKNQLGVEINPYWDAYIAARLLNENEPENGLKAIHKKYILGGQGDAFSFDDLFKGVEFTKIPIHLGYIYAARDAEITYELSKFQEPFLTEDSLICKEKELQGVAYIFNQIEMPLIPIIANMENTGIALDTEYAKELSIKYNKELQEIEKKFYKEIEKIQDKIDSYKKKVGTKNKLQEKINIASSTQVAILLYDVLGTPAVDKEKTRGTGEEILNKMDNDIARIILEYRGIAKLLSTYIDKLPLATNKKTGRVHASFNQMGADTGRFSCNSPNLQNIPSHNTEIRQMFTASEGNVLLSSDYSAQEPRLTAHMSRDKRMVQAYKDGKDLYAEMAALAFNKDYDDCKEFRADGTTNKEGKERRNAAKAIFLGICYGKGVKAIGEDLKISTKKAQEIYDSVLSKFTGLRHFMLESEKMAIEKGYVTTLWGRKRRLPNMQLERYEFTAVEGRTKDFNPFKFIESEVIGVTEQEKNKYTRLLEKCYSWNEKQNILTRAKQEGIIIKDNGGYIAEATRQCVNSRIQGSAADQTKKAMLLTGKNERLKELGFKMLLVVHDEIIAECPQENIKEVSELFIELMLEAAKELDVPSKCDLTVTKKWYGEALL